MEPAAPPMHHALLTLTLAPLLALVACATGPTEPAPVPVDPEATALFFDEAVTREARPRRRPRFEDRLRPVPPSEFRVHGARRDVARTARHGVVVVGSPARTRGPRTTSTFEVSDLVRPVRSFAAPEIGVAPSGDLARGLEEPPEGRAVIDEAGLEDLIRATIAPGTWDDDGHSIAVRGGRLIVTHD